MTNRPFGRRCARVAYLLAATAGPALADPIADPAEIAPGGAVELEAGFSQRHAAGALDETVGAKVSYSITDRLQVRVGAGVITMSGGQTYMLDGFSFGPKLVLVEETETGPALAVSASVVGPTQGDDAMIQAFDGAVWAHATKDLGFARADGNAGVNVLSMNDRPAAQFVGAVSLTRSLTDHVDAIVEGYTFQHGGDHAEHDAGLVSGFGIAMSERAALKVGTDVGLYRDQRDLTIFAIATVVPYQR